MMYYLYIIVKGAGLNMAKSANRNQILQWLLLPVARFALDRGFKHQDLVEAGKRAFIQAANEKFDNEQLNASKLSVLTGLQRYEIKRLLEESANQDLENRLPLTARILAKWANDKKYQDKDGEPKLLNCDGKQSEFAELVTEVSQAINPYTVLFELERLGVAKRTSKGLKLESSILIDSADTESGLKLLAQDSSDLIQAVSENLYTEKKLPNLHIRTEYDNIPASELEKIKLWILKAIS